MGAISLSRITKLTERKVARQCETAWRLVKACNVIEKFDKVCSYYLQKILAWFFPSILTIILIKRKTELKLRSSLCRYFPRKIHIHSQLYSSKSADCLLNVSFFTYLLRQGLSHQICEFQNLPVNFSVKVIYPYYSGSLPQQQKI